MNIVALFIVGLTTGYWPSKRPTLNVSAAMASSGPKRKLAAFLPVDLDSSHVGVTLDPPTAPPQRILPALPPRDARPPASETTPQDGSYSDKETLTTDPLVVPPRRRLPTLLPRDESTESSDSATGTTAAPPPKRQAINIACESVFNSSLYSPYPVVCRTCSTMLTSSPQTAENERLKYALRSLPP